MCDWDLLQNEDGWWWGQIEINMTKMENFSCNYILLLQKESRWWIYLPPNFLDYFSTTSLYQQLSFQFRKEQWHLWKFARGWAFMISRIENGTYKGHVLSKETGYTRDWTGYQALWRNTKLLDFLLWALLHSNKVEARFPSLVCPTLHILYFVGWYQDESNLYIGKAKGA